MHRAELESLKGEFKEWNGTRRTKFLQSIQPIIRDHIKIPIGSAVIKKNFENIIPDELKGWFGGVYRRCAHDCLVATRRWYDAQGYRNPVQWIFEAGTIGYGQVHAMFDHLYKNQKCEMTTILKAGHFKTRA